MRPADVSSPCGPTILVVGGAVRARNDERHRAIDREVAILLGDPTVEGGVGGDSEGGLENEKETACPSLETLTCEE